MPRYRCPCGWAGDHALFAAGKPPACRACGGDCTDRHADLGAAVLADGLAVEWADQNDKSVRRRITAKHQGLEPWAIGAKQTLPVENSGPTLAAAVEKPKERA